MNTKNCFDDLIPHLHGQPIIGTDPKPAFIVDPNEIIYAVLQQFADPHLAYRELVQNAQDAGATLASIAHTYDEGTMVTDFVDNGCGMNREIIEESYLKLFVSTKENEVNKVGYWSLGRIAVFACKPIMVEVVTLQKGGIGYYLIINADFSGQLAIIPQDEAVSLLGSQSGTLVRITQNIASEEAMAKEVDKINAIVIRSCRGVRMTIKVSEFRLNETSTWIQSFRIINKPPGVAMPLGSLACHREIRRKKDDSYWGDIYLGIDHNDNGGIPGVLLSKGGIVLEERGGFPWLFDGSDISIGGLKIWIESYAFKTNIGRNIAQLTSDDRFLMKAIFERVVLPYIESLADNVEHIDKMGEVWPGFEQTLIKIFSSVVVASNEHGFSLHSKIKNKRFIPGYYGGFYSLAELDACDRPIYYSGSAPNIEDRLLGHRQTDDDTILLCLQKTPSSFDSLIKKRYEGRISSFDTGNVIFEKVDDDTLPFIAMTQDDRMMFFGGNGHGNMNRINVVFARFRTPNGSPLTREKTRSPQKDTVYMNIANPEINDLITLFKRGDKNRGIAQHFLLREALLEPKLEIELNYREDILMLDAISRFCVSKRQSFDSDEDFPFFASLTAKKKSASAALKKMDSKSKDQGSISISL